MIGLADRLRGYIEDDDTDTGRGRSKKKGSSRHDPDKSSSGSGSASSEYTHHVPHELDLSAMTAPSIGDDFYNKSWDWAKVQAASIRSGGTSTHHSRDTRSNSSKGSQGSSNKGDIGGLFDAHDAAGGTGDQPGQSNVPGPTFRELLAQVRGGNSDIPPPIYSPKGSAKSSSSGGKSSKGPAPFEALQNTPPAPKEAAAAAAAAVAASPMASPASSIRSSEGESEAPKMKKDLAAAEKGKKSDVKAATPTDAGPGGGGGGTTTSVDAAAEKTPPVRKEAAASGPNLESTAPPPTADGRVPSPLGPRGGSKGASAIPLLPFDPTDDGNSRPHSAEPARRPKRSMNAPLLKQVAHKKLQNAILGNIQQSGRDTMRRSSSAGLIEKRSKPPSRSRGASPKHVRRRFTVEAGQVGRLSAAVFGTTEANGSDSTEEPTNEAADGGGRLLPAGLLDCGAPYRFGSSFARCWKLPLTQPFPSILRLFPASCRDRLSSFFSAGEDSG